MPHSTVPVFSRTRRSTCASSTDYLATLDYGLYFAGTAVCVGETHVLRLVRVHTGTVERGGLAVVCPPSNLKGMDRSLGSRSLGFMSELAGYQTWLCC